VTRVLIVDDDELIRAGLRAILDAEPDLEVVGEAADGAEVVPAAIRLRPDVVLMDVRMPALDGIQATRLLLDRLDVPPRVLVVTTFENDEYVYEALGRSRSWTRSGWWPAGTRCCSRPRCAGWRRRTVRRTAGCPGRS
jgi:DNA-binding NarL/FixJ family response regulator